MEDSEEKFPDVRFADITESPENPDDLRINVTEPRDEDREIELTEFFGDRTTDILMDYGYHIIFLLCPHLPRPCT
ncbi:hypothetical protein QUF80_21845 [Desulfococcaceae bacterium HSG8]|nr:hypothetical protein [Desulfococcaceae bacterium HSG8]